MTPKKILIIISFVLCFKVKAQTKNESSLSKANYLFSRQAYAHAASYYEEFLKKNPKDVYANRQAAISYAKINNKKRAGDCWAKINENEKADEKDKFEYAKYLLADGKHEEAKKVFVSMSNTNDLLIKDWVNAINNFSLFYKDSSLNKIFLINGLGENKPEYCPVVFGNELIYVVEQPNNRPVRVFNPWHNGNFSSIFTIKKSDSVTFENPKIFNKRIQNKNLNNGPLAFAKNNTFIYYTRSATRKEMKVNNENDANLKLHIYYCKLDSVGKANDEVSFKFNSVNYNCMHPALNKDANQLYFVSDMPGSIGGKDIWMCEWINNAWSEPVNLGPKINTKGNEVFPFINDDGILFFASDTKPGIGGLDMFFSKPIIGTKVFDEAVNMGANINSHYDDFGLFMNKDNRTGYLSSNRRNELRDDDIYYFITNKFTSTSIKVKFLDSLTLASVTANYTITLGDKIFELQCDSGKYSYLTIKPGNNFEIKTAATNYYNKTYRGQIQTVDSVICITMRPKNTDPVLSGYVYDHETKEPLAGLKLILTDSLSNGIKEVYTDSKGYYKINKLKQNVSIKLATEKKLEYLSYEETIKLKGGNDLSKNIYLHKNVYDKSITLENVYFDFDKYNVREDASIELNKLTALLKANSKIIIELNSHTDCKGTDEYNMLLSKNRAKTIKNYLVSNGISQKRLLCKAYGKTKLLSQCKCSTNENDCTEEQHAKNRRLEFKIIGQTN